MILELSIHPIMESMMIKLINMVLHIHQYWHRMVMLYRFPHRLTYRNFFVSTKKSNKIDQNNYIFSLGSCVTGTKSGIIFNNQMADFSTTNSSNKKNLIEAKKRPLSSMSPIIILDENNNVRLIIGASGGLKIFTNVASVNIF
jgi:hypothetical protein